MNYLLGMEKIDLKEILWRNVKARMNVLYSKENLSRLIKDSGVGPGTITRIKDQGTSVGIEVLEKVGAALKVEPWQLIHPSLGVAAPISQISETVSPTIPLNLEQITAALSGYLSQMDDGARDDAGDLLRKLALKPEGHARTAAMLQAAFHSREKKKA